jgi:hypothetical protein
MKIQKQKKFNKLKKLITIPLIASSIMVGVSCTSVQKREEMKIEKEKEIHDVNEALSFVRNQKDLKILNNAAIMSIVDGYSIKQFKEYSQRTPRDLNVKRKITLRDYITLITRATQDNFIYASDPEQGVIGYITLYSEHKYDSIYKYIPEESLNFISTSLGELMIKVFCKENKLFFNRIVSDSVISFLYSTYHLNKEESEKILKEIWKD